MKTASSLLLHACIFELLVKGAQATASTMMVHGSGGTTAETCFGSIFEKFTEQAKVPLRLTYRSVGSGTGIKEFVNNFQAPIVDFASGEIPINSNDYNQFQQENVTVLHLPALFGAVSFFHSLPIHANTNLNLTACLLSRIFMRDITDWMHPDIVRTNPSLEKELAMDRPWPIRVARRLLGSGNTKAITQYLHKACPLHFPPEMVGSAPEWPSDTLPCRGNSGLLNCILEEEGTIGYLVSGVGVDAGLPEVSLKNKYGRTLNSQQSAYYGGIGAKENGVLPDDPRMDFGQVSTLDQAGEFTWPITILTYIYVRLDISFMPEPNERSLLIAFLKAIYNPIFNSVCATEYGFFLAEGVSYDLAQKAISMLESHLTPEATAWTFETKIQPVEGQGDYVISSTRNSLPQDERRENHEQIAHLAHQVKLLQTEIAILASNQSQNDSQGNEHTNENQQAMVVASLVVGSLGLFVALLALCHSNRSNQNNSNRSNQNSSIIKDRQPEQSPYPDVAAC